jgi:putative redox protein
MKATIQYAKGMSFLGKAESGHWIPLDTHAGVGGSDGAAQPMEFLLIGLGGCTAMDVVSIMRKKRVPFTDFWVELEATRAEEHPKVFTGITMVYHVVGNGVKEIDVARAVELSDQKYCSATAMLRKSAPIETRIEIHQKDG